MKTFKIVPVRFTRIAFALSFLMGCAYGPQTKDKTILETLNGNHYEVGPSGPGGVSTSTLPIVKRRRANVRISGKLALNQNNIPLPLAHQSLTLLQNSKVQATTQSEVGGAFTFLGDFADGPAIIRLNSSKYSGEHSIQIKGFVVENVDFLIDEK